MKIKEIMTSDVETVQPSDTLQAAAQKMRERDIGFLPVFDGEQLIGAVTDRDLAVRAIADGANPREILGRDIMTAPVVYCIEDQDVEEAARLMQLNRIRRLVVLGGKDNRLVGVLSLGDLVGTVDDSLTDRVLRGVSTPATAAHK
jgi:CBS domain-containing protein